MAIATGSVATYPRQTWNHFDNSGPRTNNNGEAYNGKLGNVINKPNPNIWWFIELLKSENAYFCLLYHRLALGVSDMKGFKERQRDAREMQKDIDLANLKNRYLKKEFDAIELNKRTSYYMHDYSGKVKLNIPPAVTTTTVETSVEVSDIDENFLQSIDGTGMNIYEHLNNSLKINDNTTSATETSTSTPTPTPSISTMATSNKQKDDVKCDLCGRYYTKKGFTRHRNNCLKNPENHLANSKA